MHEIGHALGLKHPGNYNAGGGTSPGPFLSKSLDNPGSTPSASFGLSFACASNQINNLQQDRQIV
jgi:serralysin